MNDEDLDHRVMFQGKYGPHQGNPRTVEWVAENDPSYLVWAYEHWDTNPCSKVLYKDCVADLKENPKKYQFYGI